MAELAGSPNPKHEIVAVRPVTLSARQLQKQNSPRPGSAGMTPVGSPARDRKFTPDTPPMIAVQEVNDKDHEEHQEPEVRQIVTRTPTSHALSKGNEGSQMYGGGNQEETIDCPFKEFGCNRHGKVIDIKTHIRDEKFDHLSQLCQCTLSLKAMTKEIADKSTHPFSLSEHLTLRTVDLAFKFSSQLIWRIENWDRCVQSARKGDAKVIYSPAFYSHRHGYKLCAAIAPYGEGDSTREWISVFISILKDPNNPIQAWPFACPIKFSMLSQAQADDGQDVTSSLIPNPSPDNDAFLGRPTADRNPAFGIKEFIRSSDLRKGKFIRNDTVFLRVDVDVSGLTDIV